MATYVSRFASAPSRWRSDIYAMPGVVQVLADMPSIASRRRRARAVTAAFEPGHQPPARPMHPSATGYFSLPLAIDTHSLLSMTLAKFRNEYEGPGRPCVLQLPHKLDRLAWPAQRLWTTDQLVLICGDARFSISHCMGAIGGQDLKLKMTMGNFVRYMRSGVCARDEMPLYIFDADFGDSAPSLLRHYDVDTLKHVFPDDYLASIPTHSRPDYRWLVIGPARSGAPWHIDPHQTSAWNALLHGRKRWALYPPGCTPPGVQAKSDAGGRVTEWSSPLSPIAWYTEVFPHLAPHQRPFEVLQRAGDIVFIPNGWWHMVLNLDETVSVTHNYCGVSNIASVAEELTILESERATKERRYGNGRSTKTGTGTDASLPSSAVHEAAADDGGNTDPAAVITRGLRGPDALKAWLQSQHAAASASLTAAGSSMLSLSPTAWDMFRLASSFVHEGPALDAANRGLRTAAGAAVAHSSVGTGGIKLESHAHLASTFGDVAVWRGFVLKAARHAMLDASNSALRAHLAMPWSSEPQVTAVSSSSNPVFRVRMQRSMVMAHKRVSALASDISFDVARPGMPPKASSSSPDVVAGSASSCDVIVKLFSPYCGAADGQDLLQPVASYARFQQEVSVLCSFSHLRGGSEADRALSESLQPPALLAVGHMRRACAGTSRAGDGHHAGDISSPFAHQQGDSQSWITEDGLWRWPYVITTAVDGTPLRRVIKQATAAAASPHLATPTGGVDASTLHVAACKRLGRAIARLHASCRLQKPFQPPSILSNGSSGSSNVRTGPASASQPQYSIGAKHSNWADATPPAVLSPSNGQMQSTSSKLQRVLLAERNQLRTNASAAKAAAGSQLSVPAAIPVSIAPALTAAATPGPALLPPPSLPPAMTVADDSCADAFTLVHLGSGWSATPSPSILQSSPLTTPSTIASSAPSTVSFVFVPTDWAPYLHHLIRLLQSVVARRMRTGTTPPHLLPLINEYLPPADQIWRLLPLRQVGTRPVLHPQAATPADHRMPGTQLMAPVLEGPPPSLLHGDVTTDNVLLSTVSSQAHGDGQPESLNARAHAAAGHSNGSAENEAALPWSPARTTVQAPARLPNDHANDNSASLPHRLSLSLIDYADSMHGDPLYEMVAAYCSVAIAGPAFAFAAAAGSLAPAAAGQGGLQLRPWLTFMENYIKQAEQCGLRPSWCPFERVALPVRYPAPLERNSGHGSQGVWAMDGAGARRSGAERHGPAPSMLSNDADLPAAWCRVRDPYRLLSLLLLHPVDGIGVLLSHPVLGPALAGCPTWHHVQQVLFG